jgi:hypothetical protein
LTGNWRKSTHSGGSEGACVEVGSIPWRKSTHSGSQGGECLEAGTAAGVILVRDTKNNGDGRVLRVSAADWKRLTTAIKG